jgi:hypothetical protein
MSTLVCESEVAGIRTFSHRISPSLLSALKARGFVSVFVAEWELFRKQELRLKTLRDNGRCVRRLVIACMAVVPERPISGVRSGSVDHLKQRAKQLGRLLHRLRGLGLETVHQKAVAVIVVVEHPPQVLPGRQAPFPLQLGRNRSPADRCDPMILHPGNG